MNFKDLKQECIVPPDSLIAKFMALLPKGLCRIDDVAVCSVIDQMSDQMKDLNDSNATSGYSSSMSLSDVQISYVYVHKITGAIHKTFHYDLVSQVINAVTDKERELKRFFKQNREYPFTPEHDPDVTLEDESALWDYAKALRDSFHVSQNHILQHLLKDGFDLNRLASNFTPLHRIAYMDLKQQIPLLDLFIEKGADVNALSHFHTTLLHLAADGFNQPMIDFLMDRHADVFICDAENNTLLMRLLDSHKASSITYGLSSIAVTFTNLSAYIDRFLDLGIDLNHQNADGNTALHLLAMSSYQESSILTSVVKHLMARGAQEELANHKGKTVLHILEEGPQNEFTKEAIHYLKGFKLAQREQTELHHAIESTVSLHPFSSTESKSKAASSGSGHRL